MKNIITVGYEVPGHSDLFINFRSNKTLLDSDIVVFCPEIRDCYHVNYSNSQYQGKILYSNSGSFQLQEDMLHWKRELQMSLESGKNIFLILVKYDKFFIHTGRTTHSGTGRSIRTTNIVDEFDNYQFVPFKEITLTPTSGKAIKFIGDSLFLSFWNEFQQYFEYQNYIESDVSKKLMTTKTGDKIVAAIIKVGKGNIILLPYIPQPEEFTKYDEENHETIWTKEGLTFGQKFIESIIDIDKGLAGDETPPPAWLNQEKYASAVERKLMLSVNEINTEIESLTSQKSSLLSKIEGEQVIKGLLYETGKKLEHAIIQSLQILGYKAENLIDGDLELDQVIISPEGTRFIGEAEGKDNSQINVDKLRQLSTNLQEDLLREEIKEMATGILFGNGFRLTEPGARKLQFTDKCVSAASKTGIILMETSSLYKVCEYIQSTSDELFASTCRKIIQEAVGKVVVFPEIPKNTSEAIEVE